MIIAARFNGPPGSGNGGYTAGLVASEFLAASDGERPAAVEVTLRRPPPLDTALTVRSLVDRARLSVYDGDDLIAEASAGTVADDEIVPPISFADATAASASYLGFASHPFPTCFVCGPLREVGDGLRLFPGRLPDGRTATPFVVPAEISPALVWAALDCPGGWSVPLEDRPYVLGRLAARIESVPQPGAECVVMGEMISEEGRKAGTLTTLYSPDGDVLALARATWIALAPSGTGTRA